MKVSLLLLAIGAEAAPLTGPFKNAARRLFTNKAAPRGGDFASVFVKHRRKLDTCDLSNARLWCFAEDDCEVRRERSFSSRSLAEISPGPVAPPALSHLANAAKCQHRFPRLRAGRVHFHNGGRWRGPWPVRGI